MQSNSKGKARLGVSIRLFLADGVPDGLWVVEKSNWTGVALAFPRVAYPDARQRDELYRAGVYVLIGPSEVSPSRQTIYVGEAEVLRERLDTHQANRDFWTRAVVFASKDTSLNKAHVKYLEARLLDLAATVKRVEIENSTVPKLPALAEAEAADMEGFLAEMLVVYPVLDVRAFEAVAIDTTGERLHLKGPHATAEGKDTAEGFVVFAGSLARADSVPTIPNFAVNLRAALVEQGLLEVANSSLRFAADYVFSSPSTAAMVLLGRSANGRTEWKDANNRTLKEIQSAAVDAEETISG